jgi:pantoate--beta-alanine ligase
MARSGAINSLSRLFVVRNFSSARIAVSPRKQRNRKKSMSRNKEQPVTGRGAQVVRSQRELRAAVAAARASGKKVGVVPTMGALHAGHLSLVEACCRECGFSVVTIFVNPAQFGPNEDFTRYPRDLAGDLELLSRHPVDLVFAPETSEVYRAGHQTFVDVENVTSLLEGAHRPGHFRGVATVVLKLFHMVAPDVAFFGQKDYQQTLVVRRMMADLDLPIEIRVCPTIREPDGLAMSSRNAYLSAGERQHALALSRSLRRAEEIVLAGERDANSILRQMQTIFASEPDVRLDYIALADSETLAPVSQIQGRVVALVAAHVGKTRLIDNVIINGDVSLNLEQV